MSARDDYPLVNGATATVAFDRQAQAALDEIDRLRDDDVAMKLAMARLCDVNAGDRMFFERLSGIALPEVDV